MRPFAKAALAGSILLLALSAAAVLITLGRLWDNRYFYFGISGATLLLFVTESIGLILCLMRRDWKSLKALFIALLVLSMIPCGYIYLLMWAGGAG